MNQPRSTRNNADWRRLRFDSIDQCQREVDRIVAAHAEGTLRCSGNWMAGEILTHLAAWIEYAYDGFPVGPPPFFVRWILRWRLKHMLEKGMPRGVRIPRVEGGTIGMEKIEVDEAAERLRGALRRLASDEAAKYDSPAFGPLSHEDRIRLNLRHAELHLGYLSYPGIT